jgi:hypothetical protein
MKLFTKSIDNKLFAQFPKGGSLEGQKVIAKIFNPYGRGRWYIMNSDPEDPDYLWGIVELFDGEPEVGSFSRSELENLRVGAFKLGLERDLYFDPMDAMEVYRGLKMGNKFEEGGTLEDSTYLARMAEEYAEREYGKKAKPESTVVRASKLPNGKNYYTEITVFFTDGSKQTFEQKDFEEFFDVDDYAKGGTLKVIKDADKNQGRLYYERFNGAIGSFAWRYDKNYNEGILYPLDDFDREFYSHLKLKESEMLFRYKTDNMLGNFFPLIKINLDKMLVYFLEDSDDDKNPTFDSRGTKLEYLAIEEYYYEVREFAKGGELSMGIKTEMEEHGMSKSEATKTAKDHLREHPNYYSKMKKAGLEDGGQLELFAKGGATFDDKVRAIKRNLVGKKVPKDYQDEYGKRYDKNEAEESARRIAGAMQRNYKK